MPLRRRPTIALVLSLCALMTAAVLADASNAAEAAPTQTVTSQAPATCANRTVPPNPIDTSEQPAPGATAPAPLPVPDQPVGGSRMGECGPVLPAGAPQPPAGLTPASWVVADLDSGVVLAAKDPHGRNRPASVIKVLLSLVVLRELKLDMGVTGTQEDADMEGSKVGMGAGGQYTVRQLLQGLMLNSGNDAANALARQLGGTPETLAKMNALAKGLGALDTRAATPSGLDGPGMATSAYDIAVIFRAAMANPDFVSILGTKEATFPGFGTKQPYMIHNQDNLFTVLPGAVDLGSKSGFTDDARQTYVAAAEQNGRRLLVVMLRGENTTGTITSQAAKLLNYGFTALKPGSTEPVGQLVDKAPQSSPQPTPPAPTRAAIGQDGAQDAPQSLGTAATDKRMSDAFGNWGGPLTGAAGVLLLFALVMWWRKRKAKLAATQRASDGFSDAL